MPDKTNRRGFLQTAAAGAGGVILSGSAISATVENVVLPAQTAIPRWRGFNLINFFQAFSGGEQSDCTLKEDDLRWIRDWGFDFVRLPMDYWLWIDSDCIKARKLRPDDAFKIKESTLEKVDAAVEACSKYGLHVNLNFHRAPGYCINNPEREPFVLWSDKTAEDAFVHHWDVFCQSLSRHS